MRTAPLQHVRPLLLFALGSMAAACGARSGLYSDAGGGGGGASCAALGEPCAAATDCCDGLCADGTCAQPPPPCAADEAPALLAEGLVDPYSLGQDRTSLFVGQLGEDRPLLRIPKAGGAADVLVDDLTYVEFIAVHDGTVFYSADTFVGAVPAAGGPPAVVTSAFGPAGFAVAGSRVYLAEYFAAELVEIDRATLATKVLASDISGIYRVAVADGAVHFTSFLDGLFRHSLSTGALEAVSPELGPPRAVLALGDDVYFTVPKTRTIHRLPAGGDAAELVADLSALGIFPEALATDGEHLYTTLYVSEAPGLVVRVPVAGGAPEVVAGAGLQPSALVVDDACVYWTERESGSVFRARKAPGTVP